MKNPRSTVSTARKGGDQSGQKSIKKVQKGKTSNATNPKKPNNDPDQTPDKEVENVPVAKPGKKSPKMPDKAGFRTGKRK